MSKELNIKKAIYIGLILTIVLTWPAAWHFFTGIPGRGADTYQAISRTILVQQQIYDHNWISTLHWQKEADFWGILPLIGYTEALIGQMAGYNLWWFLSFFLAFLGMWLLVKDVTQSNWAAGIAGFVFAFAPFHFAHAVSTNIGTMHYEWLPWLAFFLHRFMRDTAWKNALGVAVSMLLIIATEHQLLAFTLIFLLFYFPFLAFVYPQSFKKWRFWAALALGAVVILVAGAVQFNKIWQIAHSQNNFLQPPYNQVEEYSADLIDFLIPARFQTLWGEHFNSARVNLASNQDGRQSFYLGYIAIFLVLFGLIQTIRKKRKGSVERRFIFFFGAVTLLFILLSLGPTLHIKGNAYLSQKLPYYWIYVIVPYWNYIRTSSRIFVIALLGWAFLAGTGAKFLEKHYQKLPHKYSDWFRELYLKYQNKPVVSRKTRFYLNQNPIKNRPSDLNETPKSKSYLSLALMGIVFIGLPIEYLSLPVPQLDLSYSPFYDQLTKDSDNYNILEIPGSTSYEFGSYATYTARIHRKGKIDGIDFARTEKDRWTFQRNTPIIESLLYSLPTGGNDLTDTNGSDIITTDYTPSAIPMLGFYNIRYLTVSKVQSGKKFSDQEFQNTVNYIEQKLGLSLAYEDNFLKAYQVPQNQKGGYYLALDTGVNDSWGLKEGTGKSRGRAAKDGAQMRLVNLGDQPLNLQVSFKASIKYNRHLQILLDGEVAKNIIFKDFKGDYNFNLLQVAPGEHTLEFKITDDNQQPITDFDQDHGIKFSQFQTSVK